MAVEDDPDLAAGELALALLEGDDLAAALRRALSEPGFAMEVERWRLRLAALFDLWPAAEPPAGLADRIERSLDGSAAAPARRSLWPILAIASSALAACLLAVIALRPEPVAPPPVVVVSSPSPSPVPVPVPSASPSPVPAPTATASPSPFPSAVPGPVLLASLGEDEPIAAAFDSGTGRLRVAAAPRTRGDRVAQLWVIGGDGVPYALGLLGDETATVLTLGRANRARIVAGATLAISIEPPGGSPELKPTGPIVATGALERV